MLRLAIVGDIHGQWSEADRRDFEELAYDHVLVVGDLSGLRWKGTLAVATAIGAMATPTLVFPGNHDASHPLQLLAEVSGYPAHGARFAATQGTRLQALRQALAPHDLVAYSRHALSEHVTLIAGRPHSMGGPELSFAAHLEATWNVASLGASVERLCALVDASETEDLVFLSHNGPSGLGDTRSDIWGCDFKREQGDWGDPDLRVAIEHARSSGRRVRAVVAGHMHRGIRGGGRRPSSVRREGTLYVNAAEVPRATSRGRHHVCLTVARDTVDATDRWVV